MLLTFDDWPAVLNEKVLERMDVIPPPSSESGQERNVKYDDETLFTSQKPSRFRCWPNSQVEVGEAGRLVARARLASSFVNIQIDSYRRRKIIRRWWWWSATGSSIRPIVLE